MSECTKRLLTLIMAWHGVQADHGSWHGVWACLALVAFV
jgi:hypothetical protein